MAATHFKVFTTTATGTLRAPSAEDHKQESLTVIDFISVQATTTADGEITIQLGDGTNIIYYAASAIEAATSDTLYIDFSGGFPCWKVSATGDDFISTPAPATSVDVNPTFGDAAGGYCIIGYHYERPTNRR